MTLRVRGLRRIAGSNGCLGGIRVEEIFLGETALFRAERRLVRRICHASPSELSLRPVGGALETGGLLGEHFAEALTGKPFREVERTAGCELGPTAGDDQLQLIIDPDGSVAFGRGHG